MGESVNDQDRADLAAAFERSVVESLLEKLDLALEQQPVREVVVAGGVAANTLLRQRAAEIVAGRARLTMPPLELCTDNAAMIAAAAHFTSPSLPRPPWKVAGVAQRPRPDGGARPIAVDPSLGWEP